MVTGKGAEPFHHLPPTTSQHGFAATSPPSKRDLASWWRQFKRNTRKEEPKEPQGIFGIPLNVSIKYANVAISLTNDNGESFIYGYVPIVVAKCGVFLKEKATDVEGIFRLSGSAKRIKDLQEIFDSPERYGKGLDWTGYTVHDAANVLRRYLNQLPEPIVPLDFYERFREPLRVYQNHVQNSNGATTESDPFDHAKAVTSYQQLIRELPPLNKQLLLYILDLLAVFASKSDQNRMTSANLSAIFQPGLLSHPQHDMAPDEYKLSQDVLIFLIENQDHFLFGMNGTAADEQTVKEVEGGMAPRTVTTNSNIRRSVSSASGGGESFRKYGSLRRNVSVSSKNSRQSNHAQGPTTPTSLGAVGVHRSNTLPSKMSPAMRYGRVTEATGLNSSERTSAQHSRSSSVTPSAREDHPQASVPPQPTPPQQPPVTTTPTPGVGSPAGLVYVHTSTHGPIPKVIPVQPSVPEASAVQTEPPAQPVAQTERLVGPSVPPAPVAASAPAPAAALPPPAPARARAPLPASLIAGPAPLVAAAPAPAPAQAPAPAPAPAPVTSALHESLSPPSSPPQTAVTPTRERKISSIFSKSPPSSSDLKEPPRQPNRLKKKRIPGSASESAQSSSQSLQAATSDPTTINSPPQAGRPVDASPDAGGATPRPPNATSFDDLALRQEKTAVQHDNGQQQVPAASSGDTTLRPYGSRTPSMNSRSSFTDVSDIDQIDEASKAERKEHRRSWRFPRSSKRSNEQMGLGLGSPPLMASTPGADRSTSSIGSWHHSSRSSPSDLQHFANDPSYQPLSLDAEVSNSGKDSGNSEPERRSLFGKFKAKVAQVRDEVKHSSERERTRSPPVQSDPEKSASSQTLSPAGKDSLPNRPAPIEVVKEPIPQPYTSTPTSPMPPGLPPAIPEEPRTPESPVATLASPEPKQENGTAEKTQTAGPETLPTFESHKGDDSETSHFLGN
ncbi:GTPase activating protein (GAP) for Rho1p [Aspergillus melleus]|uniref:GTPase activating protein (GAP) for Rho1p n=1 Tax=Aspergillus melleus TaxID=138277 RepID=A0ACC3B5V6_9EURO|nr:GTPase activating protein (GAP) for Rho1p [Aspergillus melleus]